MLHRVCKKHLEEMIFTWVSLTDPRCPFRRFKWGAIIPCHPSSHSTQQIWFPVPPLSKNDGEDPRHRCKWSERNSHKEFTLVGLGVQSRGQILSGEWGWTDKGYEQHADWCFLVWLAVTAVILVHLFDTQHFTAYLSCVAHLRALRDNIPIPAGVVQKHIKITGK